MSAYSSTINAFIEDTCVIIVVAYLLTRGRTLAMLFQSERLTGRGAVCLGLILGIVGLTEIAFPGARFPYATHTLIVTFAALNGGLYVGLVTAAVIALGAVAAGAPPAGSGVVAAVFLSALLGHGVRRIAGKHHRLVGGLVAGMLAQTGALLIRLALAGSFHSLHSRAHALVSIPANGFGAMLLQLVADDAQLRADGERHRAAAERAHALLMDAQLTALRARMHPHFLFNTLTSIAALCGVAPDKAEAAIVRLGQLMRWALEAHPTTPVCLDDEIEHVRDYLELEQQRLGGRLQVTWNVDPACEGARMPPFAVQTLVENAVSHGIAPKVEPGCVAITARRYPGHALIAVRDDGVGMTAASRRRALEADKSGAHGLQILTQQLVLFYGERARLHLFSRVDGGTLAAFRVPMGRRAWESERRAGDRSNRPAAAPHRAREREGTERRSPRA